MKKYNPIIRFPEFEGSWNESKLGSIATFSKGKGIAKGDISSNGINKCIRYGELYTYYNELAENIKSSTNLDVNNLILSCLNDVLIPASGESAIDLATATCVKESEILSRKFNLKGFKTISLSGSNTENERENAIELLESENNDNLDYIFTVDIFNEGIDIPKINQIVMLRPTQSAIVFVQQLGRGLRKTENKEYLTVIDFIGNYSNNYLVPIALYGDTSYNKDHLRKALSKNIIPGSSTINFDRISLERIYKSIDSSNMQLKKDLINDYKLLKYRLGHIPMMMDFINNKFRDPFTYVNYSKSYLNFVLNMENTIRNDFGSNLRELKLLEYLYLEINNSKRIEETLILKLLLEEQELDLEKLKNIIHKKYNYLTSDKTISSSLNNLHLNFITEKEDKKLIGVGDKYNYKLVFRKKEKVYIGADLHQIYKNDICREFLIDSIGYAINKYNKKHIESALNHGFHLYQKYSRKDVFRILNWEQNPLAQNVGGYVISKDKTNCPLFVNYHKEEGITDTTKYEDSFIDNTTFTWMSKSKRKLESPDIQTIKNNKNLHIPLFIKKSTLWETIDVRNYGQSRLTFLINVQHP